MEVRESIFIFFLTNSNLISTGILSAVTLTATTSLTTPQIYGSNAANGDITIEGTGNVTKTTSYVNLQPTGGLVGIGTTVPSSLFEIASPNPVPE